MSQYIILKDIHGTNYKFLADDDGVIQQSSNGTDFVDLSASAGSVGANAVNTAAIQNEAVTVGKMADMAAAGVLGATAAGNMAQLTQAQLTALLNPATALLPGAMSTADFQANGLSAYRRGTNLTDADITINPITDNCSLYVLPAGTLTANRVLTVTNVAGATGLRWIVQIVRLDRSAFTYSINNSTPTTLFTMPASPQANQVSLIFSSGDIWNANTRWNVRD